MASDWQPPPPPPPSPSYPPGEHKGGSSLYDALSQFFLILILLGCQHPQLLIEPVIGLLRCAREAFIRVRLATKPGSSSSSAEDAAPCSLLAPRSLLSML